MTSPDLDTPGPTGEVCLRTIAMPADTNPAGDIFGGWLLSQMDLAGGTHARSIAKGRVATRGIERMSFVRAVKVGAEVTCYTSTVRVGRTSVTVKVEAWVSDVVTGDHHKVTEGEFTFVAITADGRKREVPKAERTEG